MVLFFDEADAVLGKRSEVSDAHDRYANIEVAYLLQPMEQHDGIVVMATNLPKNIDPAFSRRIHVAVEFPMPGAAERRGIWERCLPKAAPVADLDLAFLADRFELSGGSNRNVTLSAAFFAADGAADITMETLILGLRRELDKLGRLVPQEDFRVTQTCSARAPTRDSRQPQGESDDHDDRRDKGGGDPWPAEVFRFRFRGRG